MHDHLSHIGSPLTVPGLSCDRRVPFGPVTDSDHTYLGIRCNEERWARDTGHPRPVRKFLVEWPWETASRFTDMILVQVSGWYMHTYQCVDTVGGEHGKFLSADHPAKCAPESLTWLRGLRFVRSITEIVQEVDM
jgi:hypothetical protein